VKEGAGGETLGSPTFRRDPVSGRVVALAPARARRPGARRPVADELESCPFCRGREDRTPPETLRLGNPWRVRVVPNLYPAVERQEVVVHSPEHLRTIAELADDQLDLVAEAWQLRAAAARREGFAYVHALVNEGREAGSSLPHTHSQLAWFRDVPPAPAAEGDFEALLDGPVVLERDGLVLLCPAAPRLPYELLIAPAEREANAFESDLLAPALRLAADAVRRLHRVRADAPFNLWLHDVDWWHIELVPRLSVLAGLELGAGVYVNTLDPAEAARELRSAID
jgi:UDPglucose--hexose-1-phosphate uridylyltransferase